MKATKRIFSVFLTCVLAFTMAFAMGLTASAADYTITITKPEGDIDRTYEAYQIFQGNLDGNTLSDIEWGTGIDGAAFLTELKKNAPFTSCTDAKTVAEKLATFKNNSDGAVAFAKLAGNFLTTATGSATATSSANGEIKVPAAGYYLLKDVTDVTTPHDALSLNILEVVKDVTVNPKADHPTVDKKIGTDISSGVAANEATIGDKVPFVIASKVPQMQGYTKYFFVLNDSMTAGLTYNKDVAIKIGTTTLAADAYDVVYDDTANTMKIVIKNFIQYKSEAGKDIVVTYSATLNEKADLKDGNKNTVKLTYSNNPNVDYKGDNEPDTTDPVGETPEHVTVTYSTKLQLTKVDGADHNVKLEGVEFQITGTSIKTAVSKGHYFKQDAAGTYYQLKDGTFTDTAPAPETESKYVSDLKYADVTGTAEETNMQKVTASGTTDANGVITFKGLGAGTYYITELKTLGGYNLLTAPITVEIKATPGTTSCTWTAKVNGNDATFDTKENMVKLTVENNKGSDLPITGGIGTTIFYVIGGLLVCGAVVMAITKKKLSVEDKADQN